MIRKRVAGWRPPLWVFSISPIHGRARRARRALSGRWIVGSGDVFRVELACHHQLKALFGQDGTSPRSREASDNAWVICPHQAFSIPSSLCGQQDRTFEPLS